MYRTLHFARFFHLLPPATLLLLAFACGSMPATCHGEEETNALRGYFRFHSADLEPLWGVDDHWSLGFGANFNRYTGAELAFDYYLKEWGKPQGLGEASSYHLMPQFRLQYPLFKDRIVPYILAGAGPTWIQGKDAFRSSFQKSADLEGLTFGVTGGAGVEFFLLDYVSLDLQGRYLWVKPIQGTIDGQSQSVDLSAPLFTFGLRIYFDERKPPPPPTPSEEGPVSRFYLGVRAGVDILTDDRWVPGVRLQPEQSAWGDVASQTGGFLAGVDLGRHFGFEIAVDHINHLTHVDGLGTVTEYGQGWLLANLRLRFPLDHWAPYLYGGGGMVYSEFKDFKATSAGLHLQTDSFHPAVNVGGGLEYFFTRYLSLNLDTRWAYTWGHRFGIEDHLPVTAGDYSYFAATVGFRVYLFNF